MARIERLEDEEKDFYQGIGPPAIESH